ncbi:MAG: hypothetical protein NTU41_14770 [Chloroflexi bacterium]|nr:hypothetical protein [Chloroflexota bacterium]
MPPRESIPPGSHRSPRRHGFYSQVLDEAEQMDLAEAAGLHGLDAEIAVLRLKLRQLLEEHPDRIDLQVKVASTLARLVKANYNITPEQKTHLSDAIARVLKDVAIPLGVRLVQK